MNRAFHQLKGLTISKNRKSIDENFSLIREVHKEAAEKMLATLKIAEVANWVTSVFSNSSQELLLQ